MGVNVGIVEAEKSEQFLTLDGEDCRALCPLPSLISSLVCLVFFELR